MEWDISLETGVEKIDEQHKSLFDKIIQIQEAGKNGTAADELLSTLLFLKRYTYEHFKDEEQLQIECNYPKYDAHKALHEAFIKKVDDMFVKCEENGVNLMTILETNKMVFDWLVTHITNVDKEFSKYYLEHK